MQFLRYLWYTFKKFYNCWSSCVFNFFKMILSTSLFIAKVIFRLAKNSMDSQRDKLGYLIKLFIIFEGLNNVDKTLYIFYHLKALISTISTLFEKCWFQINHSLIFLRYFSKCIVTKLSRSKSQTILFLR